MISDAAFSLTGSINQMLKLEGTEADAKKFNIHGSWASGGSISLIIGVDKFKLVQ